jgi:uncharacterized membrane protein YgcG
MSPARRAALGLMLAIGGTLAVALSSVAVPTFAPLTFGAGPPFPDHEPGRWVYDESGIWSDAAESRAEGIIDAIEARVGAQVVAYSQDVGYEVDQDDARDQAAALGTQWGVGRSGFDDGLVLLFDIDPSGIHGEVVFVSGDGFRHTYLSDEDTTRIFDERMVHHLTESPPDYDAALIAGLEAVNEAATPEQAASLERARIVNAAIGIVVAPLLGLGLVAWAAFFWLRFGRDPYYLDDPSIHMPAPPEALTAATGALVYDGDSSRRTLTTALLDLASRGELAFEERSGFLKRKVAVVTQPTPIDDEVERARQRLAARRPISRAETLALNKLRVLGRDQEGAVLEGDELLKFGSEVDTFDDMLEKHAVEKGWFRARPGKVKGHWQAIAGAELIGGFAAIAAAGWLSVSGLTIVGGALIAAAIATFVLARVMPARTMDGARTKAMLEAYRRTLHKTMEQARSMDQVVTDAAKAGMTWIETPDQALVWGVALGLQDDVDEVLRRSTDDIRDGRASAGSTYTPGWYGVAGSGGHGGWGGGGSQFSGSAIPNVGGMIGVLGSVGNSPSSSGSGGGGGGGGFGGGGGGSF